MGAPFLNQNEGVFVEGSRGFEGNIKRAGRTLPRGTRARVRYAYGVIRAEDDGRVYK